VGENVSLYIHVLYGSTEGVCDGTVVDRLLTQSEVRQLHMT